MNVLNKKDIISSAVDKEEILNSFLRPSVKQIGLDKMSSRTGRALFELLCLV